MTEASLHQHSPDTGSSRELPWDDSQTARAVIDLDAIAHNGQLLGKTASTDWMGIIKADAYGHGTLPVARACLNAGATWLGVAQLSEALQLRKLLTAGGEEHARILCWLLPPRSPQEAAAENSALRRAVRQEIDLSVPSPDVLAAIVAAARAEHTVARVHLKVDTGMGRGGATDEALPALAAAVKRAETAGDVTLVGLWSHLSRADEPNSGSTETHLKHFLHARETVQAAGLYPQICHLAATGGALWHPDTRQDLVRLGIGLYGLSPNPDVASSEQLGLRPAMRLEARLTQVKTIAAGQPVSYGGTWTAPTDRWIGLVPLGYGDGLPRAASSCGPVSVGGQRTQIVGRVCMDQVMIDLGPAIAGAEAPAQPGDVAVLWGDPQLSPGVPSADDWAAAVGTINYEIVTRVGPRVPRVYVGAGTLAT